jgi:hypothetical protein
MLTADMSLVRSGQSQVAVLSPVEWNERLTKLHSQTTVSPTSPAVASRSQTCCRALREILKQNWKTGLVAFTYWLVWAGFSLYVISNQ